MDLNTTIMDNMIKEIQDIKVGIIIPVYNRLNTTKSCIERLEKLTKSFVLYVVDDNSTDGTSQMLSQFSQVKVINGTGDLWWSGTINLGMKQCLEDGCDVFIWLNDDCLISNEHLINLATISVHNPNAIFTPSYICSYYPNVTKHAGIIKSSPQQLAETLVIPLVHCAGQCVAFGKNIFKTLGTIDTQLFPHYGDAIYTMIASKSGFPVYEVPSLQAKINFCCFRRIPPQNQILISKNPSNFSLRDLLSSKRSTYNLVHRLNWHILVHGKLGYIYFLLSITRLLVFVGLALMIRKTMSTQFCTLLSRLLYLNRSLDWQMIKLDIQEGRTNAFL
jgi:glycosyltransferase involved in cell wall biosynthesis